VTGTLPGVTGSRPGIAHFFAVYKAIEAGKGTTPRGWRSREVAEQIVEEARPRYGARPT
jgi:inorganic pyrophosphatase